MATYIRTLTDYEENEIYPHSTAEAIQRQDGTKTVEASFQNLEGLINTKANLADVHTAIDTLLGSGAAANLQTLQSLSAALGDDTNFAQNMLNALNAKQDVLTQQQCGTLLLSTGIADNNATVPTAQMVKTYVDQGLGGKIGSITLDGVTYTGTAVTLSMSSYIKTTDAGSASDPLPINADTLNGYDYNDLAGSLKCIATLSVEDDSFPMVCWDPNGGTNQEGTYNFTSLITMNPSTGDITAHKVYNAVYNDYAEWFEKDDYNDTFEAGDVCVWTGNGVKKSSSERDTTVVGVVSNNYGHILGGEEIPYMENNNKKFVPIGLAGRVDVKVYGEIEIGDLLVAGENGCATVDNNAKPNMIIGKALDNSYGKNPKKIQMLIM